MSLVDVLIIGTKQMASSFHLPLSHWTHLTFSNDGECSNVIDEFTCSLVRVIVRGGSGVGKHCKWFWEGACTLLVIQQLGGRERDGERAVNKKNNKSDWQSCRENTWDWWMPSTHGSKKSTLPSYKTGSSCTKRWWTLSYSDLAEDSFLWVYKGKNRQKLTWSHHAHTN